MSDPFTRIEALVSSVSGARRAFRNFGSDPTDLEEFFAYYEDEADRARVIARAHAAAAEVIATAAAIGDDDAARVHLVRSLGATARELGASLAAADPSFDPAPLNAALTPPAAAAPATKARVRDAVEASSDGDRARASAEASALLAFLARKPDDRTLLDALTARVTGVTKSRGGAKITCGRTVVTCTPPRKPGRTVPKSYAAVARVFGSVTWNAGAGPVGFVGVDAAGRIARSGWEPEALEEGDNQTFLRALSRAKKRPADVRCAFSCGSNWILFDPTRKAKSGEPALAFVSHGDCKWVPLRSLDALDAGAVLLRLLAWTIAEKRGLLGDVYT